MGSHNTYKYIKIYLKYFKMIALYPVIPYILESNPHPNLIRNVFADFLNEKENLVRGSNPHLSSNRPLPTRQTN